MGNDDLSGRLDPFARFRDARVCSDSMNDGFGRDHLDFVDALDEVSECESQVALAATVSVSVLSISISVMVFMMSSSSGLV